MKLRHAAALALVYLMLPPKLSQEPLTFDAHAKITKWSFAGAYDSLARCEADKKVINARWLRNISQREIQDRDQVVREVTAYQAQERCISDDDSRLEGNGLQLNTPYKLAPH